MLGIYEIVAKRPTWDMAGMASRADRKKAAQSSALAIVRKLEALRPPEVSERRWCLEAQVSSSFFSNMRGTPTKPPSDPSVDMLRSILRVVGRTLPEFFLDEDDRLGRLPSKRDVEKAVREALPDMPRSADRRAEYLVEVVLRLLALPETLPSTADNAGHAEQGAPVEAAPPLRSTKRA